MTTSVGRSARRGTRRRISRRKKSWVQRIQFPVIQSHGYGAYICGEETALLESLEGKKGQPRFKPPFPASFGLYGKPTTINNTETFAAVPLIIRKGGEKFLQLGKPNNGGTKIFSVSGDVDKPGNYEVPLGTPFANCWKWRAACAAGEKMKGRIPGRLINAGAARRNHDGRRTWIMIRSRKQVRCWVPAPSS